MGGKKSNESEWLLGVLYSKTHQVAARPRSRAGPAGLRSPRRPSAPSPRRRWAASPRRRRSRRARGRAASGPRSAPKEANESLSIHFWKWVSSASIIISEIVECCAQDLALSANLDTVLHILRSVAWEVSLEDRVWKYCCENGNVGTENKEIAEMLQRIYRVLIEVARARCPSKLWCSLAFITLNTTSREIPSKFHENSL